MKSGYLSQNCFVFENVQLKNRLQLNVSMSLKIHLRNNNLLSFKYLFLDIRLGRIMYKLLAKRCKTTPW